MEAVAFLFAKDYGLNSLMVLHWRYQRIELLRLITRLQQAHGAPIDIESAISDLQDKYVVGSVLIDFFPYLIHAAYLDNNKGMEEFFIKRVGGLPDEESRRSHFARSLYEHFTTRRAIHELSKTTLSALKASKVYGELCDIDGEGDIVPGMQKQLQDELASYCHLPKDKAKGR